MGNPTCFAGFNCFSWSTLCVVVFCGIFMIETLVSRQIVLVTVDLNDFRIWAKEFGQEIKFTKNKF